MGFPFRLEVTVENQSRRMHMEFTDPFDFIDMNPGADFTLLHFNPALGHRFIIRKAEHERTKEQYISWLTLQELPADEEL